MIKKENCFSRSECAEIWDTPHMFGRSPGGSRTESGIRGRKDALHCGLLSEDLVSFFDCFFFFLFFCFFFFFFFWGGGVSFVLLFGWLVLVLFFFVITFIVSNIV